MKTLNWVHFQIKSLIWIIWLIIICTLRPIIMIRALLRKQILHVGLILYVVNHKSHQIRTYRLATAAMLTSMQWWSLPSPTPLPRERLIALQEETRSVISNLQETFLTPQKTKSGWKVDINLLFLLEYNKPHQMLIRGLYSWKEYLQV